METTFAKPRPFASGGSIEAKARPRTWPYTCGIRDLDASQVLVRKGSVPREEVEQFIRQVEAELTQAGRTRHGPSMVVLRGEAALNGGGPPLQVEVQMPVPPGTVPPAGFELQKVPAGSVAYTVHHGMAEGLGGAERVLVEWVKMKSLKIASEIRRIYIKRGKNPRKDVTEVQIPLER